MQQYNNQTNMPTGFILINKPAGPSSHTIVNRLRKITNIRKIGHSGTLDPFANGLLILAIGRESTRQISQFVKLDKEYTADLILGATTNTYDNEGIITIQQFNNSEIKQLTKSKITKTLKKFLGQQTQIPPMFSAKKIQGQKLYSLARLGITINRPASQIEIFTITLNSYTYPQLQITVHCSSGTYIRSLAHDIGQTLGCGAYLEKLQRNKIGPFDIKNSLELEKLTPENWSQFLIAPKK